MGKIPAAFPGRRQPDSNNQRPAGRGEAPVMLSAREGKSLAQKKG
jgi:hypothetical protein